MQAKNVLIIGQGAREHALAQALAESRWVREIWAAPGNPGLAELARLSPVTTVDGWVDLAERVGGLTVVGPEAPLAAGLADRLRARGLPVVGPGAEAARLESSKIYAKRVMQEMHIATARSVAVDGLDTLALQVRRQWRLPVVIKEDGLAQGKGVTIVRSEADWDAFLGQQTARQSPARWIVEEYLDGREVSIEVLTNGRDYVWLPVAVDHKRLTADVGSPNTGGMGAYSPVPWLTEADRRRIDAEVLGPLMTYLQEHRIDYRGILYVGCMMTEDGPYVLEFNVRLGDPEASVVLPLINDDIYPWLAELTEGRLLATSLPVSTQAAVAVVVASQGYPAASLVGRAIRIGRHVARARVLHAGTQLVDGKLVSRGGRVLTVVGLGPELAAARTTAYAGVDQISLEGAVVRRDIGAEFDSVG